MSDAGVFDVFVSYRRADAERVVPFVDALAANGLKVWFDRTEIGDFESITAAIRAGLAASRCLVAWYSLRYPASRPCQMELSAAYLAAQAGGELLRRVLVINPEPDYEHIVPGTLVDALYAAADSDVGALARRIADAVRPLRGTLDAFMPAAAAAQFGRPLIASPRFAGRMKNLWDLHSALTATDTAILSGAWGPAPVQVVGMPGVGKSLFAEEYAVRFTAAYPGGIFWMRASVGPAASALRGIAAELGIDVAATDAAQLRGTLALRLVEAARRFLWIVDDVPPGLDDETLRTWFAPAPIGRTLITTQTLAYASYGRTLRLDPLDDVSAFEILASRRPPHDEADQRALAAIAEALGHHPLALEVAAAGLAAEIGLRSIDDFRSALADMSTDELELTAEFVGVLPTGHEASVAATLARALARLGREGQTILELAASLAPAPLPLDLLRGVIALAGAYHDDDAGRALRRGLHQLETAALVSSPSPDTRGVHGLVARVVQRDPARREQRLALRAAAVRMLAQQMADAADVRVHPRLRWHAVHARALLDADAADGGDDDTIALLGSAARYDHERGDFAAAIVAYRRQFERSRARFSPDHVDTLIAEGHLARALLQHGEIEEALVLDRHVADRRLAVLGPDHVDTMTALNNLAVALGATGRDEAAELQRQVLERRLKKLGPLHEHTLFSKNNLGGSLIALGRTDDGIALVREALDGRRAMLGNDHSDTLSSINQLGTALVTQGRYREAEPLLREAAQTRQRVLGADHPRTLDSESVLGLLLIRTGRAAEAADLLTGTVERANARLGPEQELVPLASNNLARALAQLEEFERARPLQERAYRLALAQPNGKAALRCRYGINLYELALRTGDHMLAQRLHAELRWIESDDEAAAALKLTPAEVEALRQAWRALPRRGD